MVTTTTSQPPGPPLSVEPDWSSRWVRWLGDLYEWLRRGNGGNIRSTLVYDAGSQVISDNTLTVINFDTQDHDDVGAHSTTTNNGRITVPEGYTKCRWSAQGSLAATSEWSLRIYLNGALTVGSSLHQVEGITTGLTAYAHISTPWLNVVEDDYADVRIFHNDGGDRTAFFSSGNGWFAAEFSN